MSKPLARSVYPAIFGFIAIFAGSIPRAAVAQGIPTSDPGHWLAQLGAALVVVEEEAVDPPWEATLLEGALRGMVAQIDPHSAYFSQEDLRHFEEDTTGDFGGIGVEVDFEGALIRVIAVVPGSPAERGGLAPFDTILAIDGTDVGTKSPSELVRAMRGPVGSQVKVTVEKRDTHHIEALSLMRERIHVQSVKSSTLARGILYLRIKSFQEGTHRELLRALDEAALKGPISGIILDLRNNPGGLVREAVAVADEFLEGGLIYTTKNRRGVQKSESASAGDSYETGPLAVLVNEYSASAAELLASALKDQHRATLLGARTFGKGSVQTLLMLESGAALKLTTALYYRPSGSTLQASGVLPDVVVDPGYQKGTHYRIVRESDLSGHLGPGGDGADVPSQGAYLVPPTDLELHLGVSRSIPKDPSTSRDLGLRRAFELLTQANPS